LTVSNAAVVTGRVVWRGTGDAGVSWGLVRIRPRDDLVGDRLDLGLPHYEFLVGCVPPDLGLDFVELLVCRDRQGRARVTSVERLGPIYRRPCALSGALDNMHARRYFFKALESDPERAKTALAQGACSGVTEVAEQLGVCNATMYYRSCEDRELPTFGLSTRSGSGQTI
jgi:hypothetical protein